MLRCVDVDAVRTRGGASESFRDSESYCRHQVSERLSVGLHQWVRVGRQSGQQAATELQEPTHSAKVAWAFTSGPDGGAGRMGPQGVRDGNCHFWIWSV